MIKTLIDKTGKVVNIIEIEENANWTAPEEHSLINKMGQIGDIWDGTKFIHTEPPIPEPVRDLAKEIDILKDKVTTLEAKALEAKVMV